MNSKTLTFYVFLLCSVLSTTLQAEESSSLNNLSSAERLSSMTEPEGNLTLSQAIALTLAHNPKLAAFSEEIRVREATKLQSGLLPNPEFSASASNFGNSKFQGFDGDAVTLQLSQLIELGGKRAARVQAAELDQQLANWEYESQRIAVLSAMAQAYINVISAQQNLKLQQELLKLTDNVTHIASLQVRAGNVAPIEEVRAKVSRTSSRIDLLRAKRDLKTARKQLVTFWGGEQAKFKQALGKLDNIQTPPALSELLAKLDNNPELKRWLTEIEKRKALVELEQANAIPDITVSIGGNNYINNDDYNLNAGISIPIPVFNRNQGNIDRSQRQLVKANDEHRQAINNIQLALNTAFQNIETAWMEITALQKEALPGAESAFKATQRGYQLGEFDFLNVLDAQRTLFRIKQQYIQALTDYQINRIKIEQLIGNIFKTDESKP